MKYWLILRRGECGTRSEIVARTSDLDLILHAVEGLYRNRLIEDDQNDSILDPGFMSSAQDLVMSLKKAIRQEASYLWPRGAEEDDPPTPKESHLPE